MEPATSSIALMFVLLYVGCAVTFAAIGTVVFLTRWVLRRLGRRKS